MNRSQSYDMFSLKQNQSYNINPLEINSNANYNNNWTFQNMEDCPEYMTNEIYKKIIEKMAEEINPQPVKEEERPKKKSSNKEKQKIISPVLIRIRNEISPHLAEINSNIHEELNASFNIKNYNENSQFQLPLGPDSKDKASLNNSTLTKTNCNSNYYNDHVFRSYNNEYPNSNACKNQNYQNQFLSHDENSYSYQSKNIGFSLDKNFHQSQCTFRNQGLDQNFNFSSKEGMNQQIATQNRKNVFLAYLDYRTIQKMNLLNHISLLKNKCNRDQILFNRSITPFNIERNQIISNSIPNSVPDIQNFQNFYIMQNSNSLRNSSLQICTKDNNFQKPIMMDNQNIIQGINEIGN